MAFVDRVGEYLTIAQAAEIKGASTMTVWSWLDKGQLSGVQFEGLGWIINKDDLMAFEPRRSGRPKGITRGH